MNGEPQTAPRFEPNDFYERLSREREEDRERFERSYSAVTQRALEAYELARSTAEGNRES